MQSGHTFYMGTKQAPDANPHSGIQPHSKGDVFPAIIGKTEVYSDLGEEKNARLPLSARLLSQSFTLSLDGVTEDFPTYESAHAVAIFTLAHPGYRQARKHGKYYPGALIAE